MKKIYYFLITAIMLFVAGGTISAASDYPFNVDYTTLTNNEHTFVISKDAYVNYERLGIPSGSYNVLQASGGFSFANRKTDKVVEIDEYKGCYVKLNNNSGFFNLDDLEFYLVYENHVEEIPRQLLSISGRGLNVKEIKYEGLTYRIKYNDPNCGYSFFNDIQKYYSLNEPINLNNTFAVKDGVRINDFEISNYDPTVLGPQLIYVIFDGCTYYETVCVVEDKNEALEEYEVNLYRDTYYELSSSDFGNVLTALVPGTLNYEINDKKVSVDLGLGEQYIFNENAIFEMEYITYYGGTNEDNQEEFCYNLIPGTINPTIYHISDRMKIEDENGNIINPVNGKYELEDGMYTVTMPRTFIDTYSEQIFVSSEAKIDYFCIREYDLFGNKYLFSDIKFNGVNIILKDYSVKVNGVEYEDIDFGYETFNMNGDYEIKAIGYDGTELNLSFRLQYTINLNSFLIILGMGIMVIVIFPMINNKLNKNKMNKEIQGYGKK